MDTDIKNSTANFVFSGQQNWSRTSDMHAHSVKVSTHNKLRAPRTLS